MLSIRRCLAWLACALLLALLAVGCRAPATPTAAVRPDPARDGAALARTGTLAVDLRLLGGERQLQFNGGSGALRNDIAYLVVGLFDYGSTTAPSLGYVSSGSAGVTPDVTALTSSGAPYVTQWSAGVSSKLGTAGTGASSSGAAISDASNLRRYIIRDYGDAAAFTSNSTTVNFTNIPAAAGDGVHRYVVFAAAYDSGQNNLGYTEAAVDDAATQGGSAASTQLTLNLKQGLATSTFTASSSMTSYRPGSSGELIQPALRALHQSLATTSADLYLEGYFGYGNSVTVNFPGGTSAAATVLGPGRAKVAVPSGATAGDLTITTRGMTSSALPFRRASYVAPGLGYFTKRYYQYDTLRVSPSLVNARTNHAAITIRPYLYVIGGYGGGYRNDVERAKINADSTLGPFKTVGAVTLVTARTSHRVVRVGDYLYVIGGYNGGHLTSVERAQINADGTIGSFETVSSVTLVAARSLPTVEMIGRFVYVFGGYNSANGYGLSSVERAAIASDGSLGPFSMVSGVTLVTRREGHASAVIGPYVYVMNGAGGSDGNPVGAVERAAINSDGTLGAFGNVASVTTQGVVNSAISVVGGGIYLIGGLDPGGTRSWVYRATINADGTISTFSQVSGGDLTTARYSHVCATAGNYLYCSGGGSNASPLASVEWAPIYSSTSLGAISQVSGSTQLTGRRAPGLAVIGRYVYIIGGANCSGASGCPQTSVERATVNDDGTLSAFATVSGVTLKTARMAFRTAITGDYLYVIGGCSGNYGTIGTVERASINADDTISDFAGQGSVNLAVTRKAASGAIIGDKLYVTGGCCTGYSSTDVATINSDGTITTFSGYANGVLSIQRKGTHSLVVGNRYWVFSGQTGSHTTTFDSGDWATINADNTLSNFTRIDNLLATGAGFGAAFPVIGGRVYYLSIEPSTNVVYYGALNSDGTLGNLNTTASGVTIDTNDRRFGANLVIGNYFYLVGGGFDGKTWVSTLQ